jgi:NitT/TauT family transport system substrate-binding protein
MTNKRSIRPLLGASLGLLMLLGATAGCASAKDGTSEAGAGTSKGTIRIGLSSWIGFGSLYVAQEQGFFKKNGLDVQLVQIEDPAQRLNAMKAGELEAAATTIDTYARVIAQGIPAKQVWALDASTGGDGVLADKSIGGVAELRGKQVAVSQGSTGEFFLAYLLAKEGMSLTDVTEVNMTSDQAGAAFAAGRVTAAVTWEPWLTNAVKKNTKGHVLASTKEYSSILVDTVGFRNDVIEKNRPAVSAFVQSLADAAMFMSTDQDKANEIVAKAAKIKVDELKGLLTTSKIFNLADNKAYFGTPSAHGEIYDVFGEASKFWERSGKVSKGADADTAISAEFLNEAK